MRGIRAWHTKLGRYLKGYEFYVSPDGEVCSAFESCDHAIRTTDYVEDFSRDDFVEGYIIREDDTGLKDKNGKEIYEGDIVRWSFKVDRNSELTYTADAVKWETYAEEEWPYSTISGFTLPESEDGYEVIGNIHENPELLEDKK